MEHGFPPPIQSAFSSAIVSSAGLKPVFHHLPQGLVLRPSYWFTDSHSECPLCSLGVCFQKLTISVRFGDCGRIHYPHHQRRGHSSSFSSQTLMVHLTDLPTPSPAARWRVLEGAALARPLARWRYSHLQGSGYLWTCPLRSSEKALRGSSLRSSLCLPGQSNSLQFFYCDIYETAHQALCYESSPCPLQEIEDTQMNNGRKYNHSSTCYSTI